MDESMGSQRVWHNWVTFTFKYLMLACENFSSSSVCGMEKSQLLPMQRFIFASTVIKLPYSLVFEQGVFFNFNSFNTIHKKIIETPWLQEAHNLFEEMRQRVENIKKQYHYEKDVWVQDMKYQLNCRGNVYYAPFLISNYLILFYDTLLNILQFIQVNP